MPLIACSTAPPRPCQKLDWRSSLGDPLRLDRRLPSKQRPEQFDRAGHQLPRGETTPQSGQALVGLDDQERMQVLLRLVPLRPAPIYSAAGERTHID